MKLPIPELRNFEEREISELSFVDWQFQMHNYFSEIKCHQAEEFVSQDVVGE